MIQNYLKTTFRNLWKNKGFTFLNIFGLGIGIACGSLIFLWVEDACYADCTDYSERASHKSRFSQSHSKPEIGVIPTK